MPRQKQAATFNPNLDGAAIPTELAGSVTGSATVTKVAGGVALTLDATSEAQVATLDMGDVLNFDIDDLQSVEITASLDAVPAANVEVGFGVCSAQNDVLDSIAEGAFFKLDAASLAIKAETDDGTTNVDDLATGHTLVAGTKTKFRLNFRDGVNHVVGGNSTAGKSAVQLAIDNGQGNLRPVDLNGTRLDMSAYSAGLQVFAQIAKTSGTVTGVLTIHSICVKYLKES